jgi:hypothetical protein
VLIGFPFSGRGGLIEVMGFRDYDE